ncbi:17174_t:CDS:2 [Cetraspora pellucida]|uniref:17174_t:CDS:1 n=1 Tax=Cetraspora pellucida TaxID=1433469 RepID=A0A9N9AMW1_9GLOM|nr:17174_t:CDS:2 [Cetraspora pellucida]
MPKSLLDIIKQWNTDKLLDFLRSQEINLDEEDFLLLRNQKISGSSFPLLNKKDLLRCKLKVGPVVTLSNLITEINTRKLPNEKIIPVIQDVKHFKWIYSRYFYIIPFEEWSFNHFERWVLQNYTVPKKEVYTRSFFKIIRKIKEDPRTLKEIKEIVSVLDKKLGIVDDNPVDKYLAYKSMLKGNILPFADLILNYHKSKSFREFKDYNEAAFQTAIELLLPTKHRQPEVRLVVDGSKSSGAGRFGFIDIFVNGVNEDRMKSSIIMELKYISLVGLLSGEKEKWAEKADYKSLKALDDKIEEEAEDELLNRKYLYWCKEKKKYEQVLVRGLIHNGMEQLRRYMKTVQKGSVNKYDGSGIYDDKIEVMKGEGYLGGVLVVSLGSKRVLTRVLNFKKINLNFSIV